MKLDPTKMKDWQIAEAAEETMKPVRRLADEMGLKEDELLPMGLQLGKRVTGAIQQPSGGPTFNIKGSATGGGLAQCVPLTPLSIRLTGDIDPERVQMK